MFKATVVASKLREKMAQYFDLATGEGVVQILHRGNDVKVLMTQEHYLNLLSRLALYEKPISSKVVSSKSAKEIEKSILAKLGQLDEEEPADDNRKLGKTRSR